MQKKFTINLNFLKLVAIVSMTLDHSCLILTGSSECFNTRLGRIAMPVFIFLIAYNFLYSTKNPQRYLKRLFAFALISQIPYFYAFNVSFFYLNVLFSLGFLGGILYFMGDRLRNSCISYYQLILGLLVCYLLLEKLEVPLSFDYGFIGLAFGVSLYAFFMHKTLEYALFSIVFLGFLNTSRVHFFYLLAYLPVVFLIAYSAKWKLEFMSRNKYLFYSYYPAHLLILILIRKLFIVG